MLCSTWPRINDRLLQVAARESGVEALDVAFVDVDVVVDDVVVF